MKKMKKIETLIERMKPYVDMENEAYRKFNSETDLFYLLKQGFLKAIKEELEKLDYINSEQDLEEYKKRLENIEEANSLRNSGLTFAEIATKMDIANPMSAYKLTKQYNKYKETGYLVIR